MPACNRITVKKLRQARSNDIALFKYATIGELFFGRSKQVRRLLHHFLLQLIDDWTVEMNIPRLGSYGYSPEHFGKIVHATDNKNNPVAHEE